MGFSIVLLYTMKVHLESVNKKLDEQDKVNGVTNKTFRYLS